MDRQDSKKIVVKIGTNVLSNKDGTLDRDTIENIVSQIIMLKKNEKYSVVIVSSGAVGAGRSSCPNLPIEDETILKQVLSSIGQVKLMNIYSNLFEKEGFICSQVLATKEDFRDEDHYNNMLNCLSALLQEKIVPIINENDVVAVRELMFTDNDELAGLIASMIGASAVFLLTSVDGVYNGNPSDFNSKLLKKINPNKDDLSKFVFVQKSSFGKGGMITKLEVAKEVAKQGKKVYIANGKSKNIVVNILSGLEYGTTISIYE